MSINAVTPLAAVAIIITQLVFTLRIRTMMIIIMRTRNQL